MFCVLLWFHRYVNNGGEIFPCCNTDNGITKNPLNVRYDNIIAGDNFDNLRKIYLKINIWIVVAIIIRRRMELRALD